MEVLFLQIYYATIKCILFGVGGTRYGLSLISVVVYLILICWEEQTLNIHTTNYSNQKHITINCISSQLDRKHVKHKFVMILTMHHSYNMTIFYVSQNCKTALSSTILDREG